MSKKKKRGRSIKTLAIRGVAFNWLGRGCSIAIAFFMTPFLVRTLGDERYGLWSILMSFTTYYALADLGMRSATTKYIAEAHALGDHRTISKIVVTSLAVYGVLSLLLFAVAGVVALLFPHVFESEANVPIRLLVLLTAATVALRLLAQVFSATLSALQRHDIASTASIVSHLVQAAAMVVVIELGYGLVGMAWATLAVATLGHVSRSILAMRMIPELRVRPADFDRGMLKVVFQFAGVTVFGALAKKLTEGFGTLAIGAVLGPAAVTIYAIPEVLTRKSQAFASGVNSVLFPVVSRLEAQGKREVLTNLAVSVVSGFLALALVITVLFICLGRPLIGFWVGAEYVESCYPILCVLAAASAIRLTGTPLHALIRGTAFLKAVASIAAIEATLTVVLASVGLYFWSMMGLVWGLFVSQAIATGACLPITACQLLDLRWTEFARRVLVRGVGAAVPGVLAALGLAVMVSPRSLVEVLLLIPLPIAVVTLGILLICLQADRRRDVFAALGLYKRRKKSHAPQGFAQPVNKPADTLITEPALVANRE